MQHQRYELQALIGALDSADSSVRDKAALQLMDIGDPCAVDNLLRAISKPENKNHRGTLVYVLSAFDCEPFVEVLVELALTGNFEVSMGALSIIEESTPSKGVIQRVDNQLDQHKPKDLVAEHHKTAYEALSALSERHA